MKIWTIPYELLWYYNAFDLKKDVNYAFKNNLKSNKINYIILYNKKLIWITDNKNNRYLRNSNVQPTTTKIFT